MSSVQLPQPIFVVSDGTGDTAEKVVRAVLHQFKGYLVLVRTFPHVDDGDKLARLMRLASQEGALVVTTLVTRDMRILAQRYAAEHRVRVVDLIGRLLNQLGTVLDAPPDGVPGRMQIIDDAYFQRIEAVEFTVKADDGKEPRMLRQADIALVGVSRTSKTPLSVFLAHKGYKVSNVPIVLDRPLPAEVHNMEKGRVIGLTIDPEALREIRVQRLATMRVPGRSNYGDMEYILAELDYAEDLFRQHPHWPVIDVTRRAVEETASIILRILADRGLAQSIGEVGQL